MNKPVMRSGNRINQIAFLVHSGLLDGVNAEKYEKDLVQGQPSLPNPYDSSLGLEARVRSYLHANCAHCHIEAGGGNAKMELEWSRALKDTFTVGVEPVHSRFGLGDKARIVSVGDLGHSVMLQRIIRPGPGRMPPVGGVLPDPQWINLFTRWVSGLKPAEQ